MSTAEHRLTANRANAFKSTGDRPAYQPSTKMRAFLAEESNTWNKLITDAGINDDFMRDLGAKLTPGTAAVFVLVRKISADKVAERLATLNAKGHILQTSLSKEDEAKLRGAFEATPA